ncbi:hypothetical protein CANTEDRAFT_112380, partial [Yamadazyma tenuis ATCC 10573]
MSTLRRVDLEITSLGTEILSSWSRRVINSSIPVGSGSKSMSFRMSWLATPSNFWVDDANRLAKVSAFGNFWFKANWSLIFS